MLPILQCPVRDRFWRSLVFCLWLGSFVFSFAFSDCFHSQTCPEHALMQWASHSGHASFDKATFHSAGADIECASCAVHSVDFVMVEGSAALSLAVRFAALREETPLFPNTLLPRHSIARGPPSLQSLTPQ